MATQSGAILRVDNLVTCFGTGPDRTVAVNGLSFSVDRGETLGIVGESGCGKSVTSLSIMRLLAKAGKVTGGTISFNGTNLVDLSEKEMRRLRGNRISMIFQEPMTSLNPTFTVGRQIAESIMLHQRKSKSAAMAAAIDLLKLVQISDAPRRLNEYPHQLSGGMRQRVMIAMALACQPDVLIADEPTTALDVTIQAQILELLREIQIRLSTAIVLITHDLGVVAQICDRVIVMYAGKSVEEGRVKDVLEKPQHPYTQALIRSLPAYTIEQETGTGEVPRLAEIPGIVPVVTPKSVGCTFAPRCSEARPICAEQDPPVVEFTHGQSARCWARLDGEKTL